MKRPQVGQLEYATRIADDMLKTCALPHGQWSQEVWQQFTLEANPKNILELIRYVQILEKALDNAISDNKDADTLSGYLEVAERELFPEEQR